LPQRILEYTICRSL